MDLLGICCNQENVDVSLFIQIIRICSLNGINKALDTLVQAISDSMLRDTFEHVLHNHNRCGN